MEAKYEVTLNVRRSLALIATNTKTLIARYQHTLLNSC